MGYRAANKPEEPLDAEILLETEAQRNPSRHERGE